MNIIKPNSNKIDKDKIITACINKKENRHIIKKISSWPGMVAHTGNTSYSRRDINIIAV
jgi:hypothetical protein